MKYFIISLLMFSVSCDSCNKNIEDDSVQLDSQKCYNVDISPTAMCADLVHIACVRSKECTNQPDGYVFECEKNSLILCSDFDLLTYDDKELFYEGCFKSMEKGTCEQINKGFTKECTELFEKREEEKKQKEIIENAI